MAKSSYKIIDFSQINYQPEENEIVQDRATKNLFIYRENHWMLLEPKSLAPEMSLYELNKQLSKQQPSLSENQLDERIEVIKEWMIDKDNDSYMLYGKEISYFSLFNRVYNDILTNRIKETLMTIGDIRSIDITEDNSGIEIWISTKSEQIETCLYLFPYDDGVIKI